MFFPVFAPGLLDKQFDLAQIPHPNPIASRSSERQFAMREDFELNPGDRRQARGCDHEHVVAGVSDHEDRIVGLLDRMV